MQHVLLDAAREINPGLLLLQEHQKCLPVLFGAASDHRAPAPALLARQAAAQPRRIIAAIGDLQHGDEILRQAARFALRFDADVTVLHVISGHLAGALGVAASETERRRAYDSLMASVGEQAERCAARLRQSGVRADALVVIGEPANAIVRTAQRLEADLIVVGARPPRALTRLFGVLADEVLRDATASVIVAPVPA